MRIVDIPGGLATFKTREELRGRDSKLVKASAMSAQGALEKMPDDLQKKPGESMDEAAKRVSKVLKENKINFTPEESMSLLTMTEAIAVAYLHSWTISLPLPTLETIGDLPDDLYEALMDAVGGDVIAAAIGTDFSANPDMTSPTGPSSDSAGSLRESVLGQTVQSTLKPQNDIEASPIEKFTPV